MARSSFTDIQSLQDPAQSWNFSLFLPTIPGSSDTRDLTFKCMTTDMPGAGLDDVAVPLAGVELHFAGRATFTHDLNVTFLETSDWGTREKFRRWRETIRSWDQNTGSPAAAYKVNAMIEVYNDIPQVVRTCQIKGLWPMTIAEVQLDGGQSNLVTLQITFKYDQWQDR